jgi:serine/threonine protein kinase
MSKLPIMVYVRRRCGTGRQLARSAALQSSWHLRYVHVARLPQVLRTESDCKILLEQRYGRAVDWWAFGVLTYEMLLGQSPFRGDDEDEIFDAILEDEPLYPITMPRDAVSILQKVSPTSKFAVPPSFMFP